MQHVIIVIHLMLVLALIGVVLLQRSEGGGLGIGSTGGFMTSRGTANVLTRATAILAGLFFVTSLMLSILAGINRKPTSILQGGRVHRPRLARRRRLAAEAACLISCKAEPRRPRPRLQQPRRGRRCRSRNEIASEGPGNSGPSALWSACIGLEANMKITSQAFGKSKNLWATHSRRSALCFSRSSNRFAGAKG